MNPKEKGEMTEAKVMSRLVELGVDVFLPFGENGSVDMVVDVCGLQRLQVKTSHYKDTGVIQFNTSSTRNNRTENKGKFDYEGEIDAFLTYCPQTDEYFWVDIEDAPKTAMKIRVEDTSNHQVNGINWAEDYRLRGVVEE